MQISYIQEIYGSVDEMKKVLVKNCREIRMRRRLSRKQLDRDAGIPDKQRVSCKDYEKNPLLMNSLTFGSVHLALETPINVYFAEVDRYLKKRRNIHVTLARIKKGLLLPPAPDFISSQLASNSLAALSIKLGLLKELSQLDKAA